MPPIKRLRNEALLERRHLKHPFALVVVLTLAYWAAYNHGKMGLSNELAPRAGWV